MSTKDLFVDCECGVRTAVSAGMAGSTLTCRCGQTIALPALGELRHIAGRDRHVTNAAELVNKAINSGRLPGTTCVFCERPSSREIRCEVVCESSAQKQTFLGEQGDLLASFLRILFPLPSVSASDEPQTVGHNTIVRPVIRLCHSCQATLGNPRETKTLRKLMDMVPEYSKLFREYPYAEIHFVNATE
jgi:hypothetical protein